MIFTEGGRRYMGERKGKGDYVEEGEGKGCGRERKKGECEEGRLKGEDM